MFAGIHCKAVKHHGVGTAEGGGLRAHTHTDMHVHKHTHARMASVWFRSNNSQEKIVDGGEKVIDREEEKKFKSAFYPRPIILSGPVCLNGS